MRDSSSRRTFEKLIGTKIGRLQILDIDRSFKPPRFNVKCECGTLASIPCPCMTRKVPTKSCGCLHREVTGEAHKTHGGSKDPKLAKSYRAWKAMRRRCLSPQLKDAQIYKGISFCKRWSKFENFLEDMGVPPANHSLDRMDGRLGYSKENCRWATPKQQSQNRKSLQLCQKKADRIRDLRSKGVKPCEILKIVGCSLEALRGVLYRGTWSK